MKHVAIVAHFDVVPASSRATRCRSRRGIHGVQGKEGGGWEEISLSILSPAIDSPNKATSDIHNTTSPVFENASPRQTSNK